MRTGICLNNFVDVKKAENTGKNMKFKINRRPKIKLSARISIEAIKTIGY